MATNAVAGVADPAYQSPPVTILSIFDSFIIQSSVPAPALDAHFPPSLPTRLQCLVQVIQVTPG